MVDIKMVSIRISSMVVVGISMMVVIREVSKDRQARIFKLLEDRMVQMVREDWVRL
jgi:hypothetical protein